MINSEHLCMSCMKEIGEVDQCPYCGFHVGTMQISPYLAVRTVIANRYLVGKLLEYNGDGATYIAWDINEKKPVTIREFFPDTLVTRRIGEREPTLHPGCELVYNECKADFVELWRKLTRMSGLSALVNVYDVFEENNTAYAICEYVKSITLRDYLLRLKTGYIPWERARVLFMPVLSTLGMLHTAGIIHRGISPLTLQIGQDGKMRIGGFSIWQARTAKSDLTAQLFSGYAAIEQYGFEGKQGPCTDIYAFAATLYRALIGSDPIEATERLTNDRLMVPAKFAEQLPAYVINGLINALQIMPEERTRSVEQLRADLSASPVVAAVSHGDFDMSDPLPADVRKAEMRPEPTPVAPTQPSKKGGMFSQNKMLILRTALISAIICLVICLIIVFLPDIKNNFIQDEPVAEATTRGEVVTVTDFRGRDYSEISNDAYWVNQFSFDSVEEYSDDVPKGIIIAQSIPPKSQVNAGTKIVFTVSKGIEHFELPPVIGMDYEEARDLLKQSNFKVSKETKENDGTHTENVVESIKGLMVGKAYPKGTAVVLSVWGEPPAEETETTTQTSDDNKTSYAEVRTTKPSEDSSKDETTDSDEVEKTTEKSSEKTTSSKTNSSKTTTKSDEEDGNN
ncbi:MAG: PASTA domain-containing protein [Clostridia bacterium]|nr:PASTA domain-containing protein [Clostridia bacterium]